MISLFKAKPNRRNKSTQDEIRDLIAEVKFSLDIVKTCIDTDRTLKEDPYFLEASVKAIENNLLSLNRIINPDHGFTRKKVYTKSVSTVSYVDRNPEVEFYVLETYDHTTNEYTYTPHYKENYAGAYSRFPTTYQFTLEVVSLIENYQAKMGKKCQVFLAMTKDNSITLRNYHWEEKEKDESESNSSEQAD